MTRLGSSGRTAQRDRRASCVRAWAAPVIPLVFVLLAGVVGGRVWAATAIATDVVVRGKKLTFTVYAPTPGAPVKGTVLMGSGDVGWVGLAVTLAEFLSDQGYVVGGINVRQYLSAFTDGKDHVGMDQVPADYRVFADALAGRSLLRPPVVLSGVSEGAALAVAAAAGRSTHDWARGVITLGLPPSAELAMAME